MRGRRQGLCHTNPFRGQGFAALRADFVVAEAGSLATLAWSGGRPG